MVWNVQSICNKVDEVISILSDNGVVLAFFSETWFSTQKNTITALLKSAGFNIVHSFRKKRGGGVGILWHESLDKRIKVRQNHRDFTTFQYQNLFFHGNFKINLICLYRLQETSFSLFIDELNSLLSDLDSSHPIILSGDFNVHFEKKECANVKKTIRYYIIFWTSAVCCWSHSRVGPHSGFNFC